MIGEICKDHVGFRSDTVINEMGAAQQFGQRTMNVVTGRHCAFEDCCSGLTRASKATEVGENAEPLSFCQARLQTS